MVRRTTSASSASRLDPERYETLLLHGEVGAGEDSLEDAVRARGVAMARVPGLSPELRRPHDDLRALGALVARDPPPAPGHLHTHTAKAGMLGRTRRRRWPGSRDRSSCTPTTATCSRATSGTARNAVYRGIEQRLAGVSDALIGVSDATVDDLVRLGVAPREKFRVIPIGLELDRFLAADPPTTARRSVAKSGVREDELLLTFVGRLVPIKRVDVLLRGVRRARGPTGAPVRLAIVGDGELRGELERLAAELGVARRASGSRATAPTWCPWRPHPTLPC